LSVAVGYGNKLKPGIYFTYPDSTVTGINLQIYKNNFFPNFLNIATFAVAKLLQ